MRCLLAGSLGFLCAVLIAACGGSGSGPVSAGTGTNATGDASPIAMSKCMRAAGLTNFPDPTQGPGGEGFNGISQQPNGTLVVDGITFGGPALAKAQKACSQYLPPKGPPPKPTAAEQAQAVKLAQCMRDNGVPSFPDPTFGGGPQRLALPDINTPAFQHAVSVCGKNGRLQFRG